MPRIRTLKGTTGLHAVPPAAPEPAGRRPAGARGVERARLTCSGRMLALEGGHPEAGVSWIGGPGSTDEATPRLGLVG